MQQFSGMSRIKIQEVFHLTKSPLYRYTRTPSSKQNYVCTYTYWAHVLPTGAWKYRPRSASNSRERVTYVHWTGAAVIWGWDKRKERLWKWKHRFSLLLHRQSSSGGPRLSKILWSPSHKTPAACLTDNEEGRRWVCQRTEERHKFLRDCERLG